MIFFGRRILGEGTLTNITAGGEGCIDMPQETRDKLSASLKQHYIDNPEAREEMSKRMTQFYIDHPEMKDQISQSVKIYISDHPEFVESLQESKNNWIENCPEEYAEAERKRLEICRSDEHRNMISEIMTQYFKNNPEEYNRLVEQATDYWKDNPEACEAARQRAIDYNSHENIIRWLKEEPEACREKWDRHSEYMTQWYQDNPDKAELMIEARNKVLKSDSHRRKMCQKTSEYMENNPDVVLSRVDSMKTGVQELKELRSECLCFVRDKLVELNEIDYCEPTSKKLMSWKKRGLMSKYFPNFPANRSKFEWENFKIFLSGTHAGHE